MTHRAKNLRFFRLEALKNFILNETLYAHYAPERAARKQIMVFISKIFKITKVQGGRRNEQKGVYLAEAVTQKCFAKTAF